VVDGLSSELLGFGRDARVLIVNCDDFGMNDAVNSAVVKSIENGIASSCSLIVPCPAAADAMRLLRERPHISFGIHLALIRESPEYGWGPAAAKADVPSLLDPEDHAFLTSQEALEILDRVGITVIDYRLLQQAWNT
jgi:YdjC-like protein